MFHGQQLSNFSIEEAWQLWTSHNYINNDFYKSHDAFILKYWKGSGSEWIKLVKMHQPIRMPDLVTCPKMDIQTASFFIGFHWSKTCFLWKERIFLMCMSKENSFNIPHIQVQPFNFIEFLKHKKTECINLKYRYNLSTEWQNDPETCLE